MQYGGYRPRRGGFGGRDRGGGFRERSFEKPIREGEEYDVQITEVGSKGDGIARVKNFVVFVPGTKQGEKVHIRITQVRARSAVGEVVGGSSAAADVTVSEEGDATKAPEGENEEETEEEEEEEETEEVE